MAGASVKCPRCGDGYSSRATWVREGRPSCFRCSSRKPRKRLTKGQQQTKRARAAAAAGVGNSNALVPVGVVEIAERFGVKVDTVHHWRIRHADSFPASRGTVGGIPWYSWAEVRRWHAARASRGGR